MPRRRKKQRRRSGPTAGAIASSVRVHAQGRPPWDPGFGEGVVRRATRRSRSRAEACNQLCPAGDIHCFERCMETPAFKVNRGRGRNQRALALNPARGAKRRRRRRGPGRGIARKGARSGCTQQQIDDGCMWRSDLGRCQCPTGETIVARMPGVGRDGQRGLVLSQAFAAGV